MTLTSSGAADVVRLTALIARQRRELDRMRAQAAARSVVDMAQGILMERLGCSAAEASEQLARLASDSGTPLVDLAAEVTGQQLARVPEQPAEEREPPRGGDEPGWRGLGLAAAAMRETTDDTGHGDSVAAAALEEVLAPAGAVAVALWVLGPDGRLDLVGQAGLGPREAGRWSHLAPDLDSLPQRVARGGTEILWPAGRPAGDPVPVVGGRHSCATAVLPMRGSGMLVGVLTAIWPAPLPCFEPPLLRQLTALADLCAQAVSPQGAGAGLPAGDRSAWLYGLLDGVVESAMFAYPVRDDEGTVTDFLVGHVSSDFRDPVGRKPGDLTGRPLLEVYPLAALPGGLFDRAVEVLATGAPQHVSGGILSSLVSEPGATALMDIRVARLFGGVVIALRRVDEAERLASLLEHAERLGRIGGWEENLLTGEIRWSESACALFGLEPGSAIPLKGLNAHVVPDDVFDLEQFRDRLLREKRATAAAFRIIRADDESVRQMRVFAEPVTDPAGSLAAVRGAFQDVSTHYHTQLALTATRDRLADTEERAQEEHRLALRLQQAITPWSSEPVAAAGLEIAARYRPAGPAHLVSGDWYDTVLLPAGNVLLVVGDIAGHGIDAVTGMVEMRNCLRGFAVTGATPVDLLGWLNKVACHLTEGTIGTAVCGLYDPASRELRWARAGHLAPVLVRDGDAGHLDLPPGLILGADPDARYEEAVTRLDPGDVLLLFTDGLVERRDLAIDDALEALLAAASRPVAGISDYADYLLRHSESNTGDDACLVAVHVR
jgi:PAS domain-containing protein